MKTLSGIEVRLKPRDQMRAPSRRDILSKSPRRPFGAVAFGLIPEMRLRTMHRVLLLATAWACAALCGCATSQWVPKGSRLIAAQVSTSSTVDVPSGTNDIYIAQVGFMRVGVVQCRWSAPTTAPATLASLLEGYECMVDLSAPVDVYGLSK